MILKQLGIFGWKEADENLVLPSLLTGTRYCCSSATTGSRRFAETPAEHRAVCAKLSTEHPLFPIRRRVAVPFLARPKCNARRLFNRGVSGVVAG